MIMDIKMEKMKLKRKYTDGVQSSGGKSGSSNSSVKPVTMQKLLFKNARAIELHYTDCAVRGLFEQIPTGQRAKYKKMQKDHLNILKDNN